MDKPAAERSENKKEYYRRKMRESMLGYPKGSDPKTRKKITNALVRSSMEFSQLQKKTGLYPAELSEYLEAMEKEKEVRRKAVKGHVLYSLSQPPLWI